MADFKLYRCEKCGNIVMMLHDAGVVPACCGSPMVELVAGTVDAAREKHVPAVTRTGDCIDVVVGSDVHPMLEAHYIEFIAAVCGRKVQIQYLKPGEEPRAHFCIGEGPVRVYEYCNLHGLWMAEA